MSKIMKIFVFLLLPDFLFIIYIMILILWSNILGRVMILVKLVSREEQEVLIIVLLAEKDLLCIRI